MPPKNRGMVSKQAVFSPHEVSFQVTEKYLTQLFSVEILKWLCYCYQEVILDPFSSKKLIDAHITTLVYLNDASGTIQCVC